MRMQAGETGLLRPWEKPIQSPCLPGAQAARSRQGKMEKSLLSFAATYPTWEPDAAAKQLLSTLAAPGFGGAPGPHFPYTSHVPDARSARLGPHLFLGPARWLQPCYIAILLAHGCTC